MQFSRWLSSKALLGLVLVTIALAGLAHQRWFKNQEAMITLDQTPFRSGYIIPSPPETQQKQISVYLILQTGEAEMTGPEGMLHYVEHLAWLNAIGPSTDTFQRHSNAWTTSQSVGYWINSSKADLKVNLAILSKILEPISLDEKFALQERDIVRREYDLRTLNSPEVQLVTAMDRELYAGNGLARSVMGEAAEIVKFDLSQAKALHARSHLAKNAVIVVVGDVSASEVYAALPQITKTDAEPVIASVFQLAEPITKSVDNREAAVASKLIWRRVTKLPASRKFDEIVLQCNILSEILNSNLPGGLTQPLRYDAFVARDLAFSCSPIDNNYVEIQFSGYPAKNVSLTNLRSAFEEALAKTAGTGIPQETFDRVKTRFDLRWPKQDDDVAVYEWTRDHSIERISLRQVVTSLDDVKKISAELTLSQLNSLLKTVQAGGRTVISKLGKEMEGQ